LLLPAALVSSLQTGAVAALTVANVGTVKTVAIKVALILFIIALFPNLDLQRSWVMLKIITRGEFNTLVDTVSNRIRMESNHESYFLFN
jgi:hypothetical protein